MARKRRREEDTVQFATFYFYFKQIFAVIFVIFCISKVFYLIQIYTEELDKLRIHEVICNSDNRTTGM